MKTIPLTPKKGGGLCISAASLQPADIVVATTDAVSSAFIRYATFSAVSHAFLYAGNDQVIEAIAEGVVERILTKAIEEDIRAVVYRHPQMTPMSAETIIRFARRQVGKHYDYAGAAQAGIHNNPGVCVVAFGIWCPAVRLLRWDARDKFFCSELVLAAYEEAGLSIIDRRPDQAAPDDIARAQSTGKLLYVGHLIAG
jgi:uncharacterized protein YycO